MKKLCILIIACFSLSLYADFIVPQDDPVYTFLEMSSTLGYSNLNLSIYPLYYQDIVDQLVLISNNRTYGYFKNHAMSHLRRLALKNQNGYNTDLLPVKELPEKFISIFTSHYEPNRLFTYGENNTPKNRRYVTFPENTSLYLSGILGYKYDLKKTEDLSVSRNRKYWGMETAGNFKPNFGYFLQFKKGSYTGDEDFIKENPDLSIMGNNYYEDENKFYQVDMTSELDFKNDYLNLSMGYGQFKIGYSLGSSIILNPSTTPYGYLKYYKNIGHFTYTGIGAQLIPDSLQNDPYKPKSLAIQTIAYNIPWLTIGLGNAIIYGDKTLDLAYISPLAIYKIMDNKNHGRDNGILFGFSELRPISGLAFHINFLADDITNSRIMSKYMMNYLAFQGGLKFQASGLPLDVGSEVTAVGPGTYNHKSKSLFYSNDHKLLGSEWGSNFLCFTGKIRFAHPAFNMTFQYDNVQQGDLANDPLGVSKQTQFLHDNIERYEVFKSIFQVKLFQELDFNINYEYKLHRNEEIHYIYSGAEFKY